MESVQGWDEGWDETDGSSALAVGVGTPRMVGATRSGGQRPVDSTVLRRYDGSHLTLPDLSAAISPHAHQKEAVWRIVSEPTVLLDHAVRADKTGEMIVVSGGCVNPGFVSRTTCSNRCHGTYWRGIAPPAWDRRLGPATGTGGHPLDVRTDPGVNRHDRRVHVAEHKT